MVTQGQMLEAITCFIKAGANQDACLLAERYLDTATLQDYIDSFELIPNEPQSSGYYSYYYTRDKRSPEGCRQSLIYLLARRLFRENRTEESLPYYYPSMKKLAQSYMQAIAKADDKSLGKDIRAAHLFHAARIMRWKGMELCGTELNPDYTIVNGRYEYYGMDEKINTLPELAAVYKNTAPEPNVRFHYRPIAIDLAKQAVKLTQNRHQRATILWCLGNWLKHKAPKAADVYYKQLAYIRFSALAKATYNARWFAPVTPNLESVFTSLDYIEPAQLIKTSQDYTKKVADDSGRQ